MRPVAEMSQGVFREGKMIRARELLTGRLCRYYHLVTDPSVIIIRFDDSEDPRDTESYRIDPDKPRFILLEETET